MWCSSISTEGRDAGVALIINELQDHDKKIQTIKYHNIVFHSEIHAKSQQIEKISKYYQPP